MDVSVIIPLYNLEKYIEKSIKSVLTQDFDGEFEVIVVDDGSKDKSIEVVQALSETDSRIKLIHQENSGVSSARNKGIDAANGKYIVFVDGDDILFPNALQTLVDSLLGNSETIVACGVCERIISYNQERTEKDNTLKRSTAKDALKELLTGNYDVSACAKIFIKEKIGSIRFVQGKRINEDKYFLFQYLLNNEGDIVDINSVLYGYYIRPGSVTNSSFSDATLDMLYFSEKIEEGIKSNFPNLIPYAHYNNLVTHLAVLKKIVRSKCYNSHKTLFKKLRKETVLLSRKSKIKGNKNHKMEAYSLQICGYLYIMCVKMFDLLRKGKEKEKTNEN